MSYQEDVKHYRDREAAQRALADRVDSPSAKASINALADAYAAAAASHQALLKSEEERHEEAVRANKLSI